MPGDVYEEIIEKCAKLEALYPMVHIMTMGYSADGRKIQRIVLGRPDAKHAIFIVAGLHGREYLNSSVLINVIEQYCVNWNNEYKDNLKCCDILSDCCIHFVPLLNPDGVAISQHGPHSIRSEELRAALADMEGIDKHERWASNARGVNLNRNFPYNWEKTSDSPSFTLYAGQYPASEPETQCFIEMAEEREFDVALMLHSAGNLIFWDLGQIGKLRAVTERFASKAAEVSKYVIGERSKPMGLEYNYLSLKKNIPTILLETGYGPCPLADSEFNGIFGIVYTMIVEFGIICKRGN